MRPRALSSKRAESVRGSGKTRSILTLMLALEGLGGVGVKKTSVIIYTRPGCHLCDEAKASMLASGCEDEFTIEEVNIDLDPDLSDRYGWDIPVVFINGVKAFKHRVDASDFKRKLRRLAGSA